VSSERGFTLIEVLVAATIGIVVMLAILGLVDASSRGSARVAARVAADQRARPVLQHLIDELHSTCVGPNTMPVLANSTQTQLVFLSQTGSAVSPTPDKHVVTLNGTTLTESIYPATGGSAPNWTFDDNNPSSTRELLTGVGPALLGSPPSAVDLFRYYKYQGAQLSSSPLQSPLTAADAAQTAEVVVSFSASPRTNPVSDPNASVSVSDGVILRLSPASENASELNPPCA
jgi:type II secretory pathway pseudopilin PulG